MEFQDVGCVGGFDEKRKQRTREAYVSSGLDGSVSSGVSVGSSGSRRVDSGWKAVKAVERVESLDRDHPTLAAGGADGQ